MNGFNQLLENQKKNTLISDKAYTVLKDNADSIIQRMIDSLLQMTIDIENAEIVVGETSSSPPTVRVQLENTGEVIIEDPMLTVLWPEEFSLDPLEKKIQRLNPGESTEALFEIDVPENMSSGNYPITVQMQFDHHGIVMEDSEEQLLHILPIIDADLNVEKIKANKSGDYPISLKLKNNTNRPINVGLEAETSDHISLDLEDSVKLEPGQIIDVEGNVRVSADLLEGEYEVTVNIIVDGTSINQLPLSVSLNKNLLKNPGFEKPEEDKDEPTGWNLRSGEWVRDEVHSGEYAVTLIADPENDWNVMNSRENIPVTPGAKYKLSGWVKTNPADGHINVMLRKIDGDNSTIEYDYNKVTGTGDWEYFERVIDPGKDTKFLNVFFHISATNATQAWFDDFRLEEVNDDGNLFTNPGFEEIDDGAPLSWNEYGAGWTDIITASPEAARTGNYGIKMTTDTTDNYLFGQAVGVEAGKTYDLSAWLKSDIADGGKAQIKIDFYKDKFKQENHKGAAVSDAYGTYTEWEEVGMQVEVPEDANLADILFRVYGPGTAYYDDLSLRLVSE